MVRLILVEDDRTMRETVTAYLTRADHEVIAVSDGDSAIARFPGSAVELVVVDLMLPGMSGLDVTRRLRTARPEVLLIMATARAQEHERVQGLLAGADDYITKPYSLRELDLRIRSLVRRATSSAAPREDRDRPVAPDTSGDGVRQGLSLGPPRRSGAGAMTPDESAVVLSIATTAGVGLLGTAVVAALPRSRPTIAAIAAPFVVVASLAAGVAVATRQMLIDDHTSQTLLIVLAVCATSCAMRSSTPHPAGR